MGLLHEDLLLLEELQVGLLLVVGRGGEGGHGSGGVGACRAKTGEELGAVVDAAALGPLDRRLGCGEGSGAVALERRVLGDFSHCCKCEWGGLTERRQARRDT